MRTDPDYAKLDRIGAGWMKARIAMEAYKAERQRERDRGEVKRKVKP